MQPCKTPNVIYPEDRLPFIQNTISGLQHVVAMFGGTVLGPLLMGFNPNVAIFFSGIATLIFYISVRGRVPSYLGSSFSFVAAVIAATAYSGSGPNQNIPAALGGIIIAGALYAAIGLVVVLAGYKWIERVLPPVLTGAIVAIIGLNLAPVAVHQISGSMFDTLFGLFTILLVALSAVYLRGFSARFPILIGGGLSYLVYFFFCNIERSGRSIDFSGVSDAAWFGLPHFMAPSFDPTAIFLIAPVAVILVAENLGHIRAIGAMTGRDLDPYLGRAFMGDGIATIVSACFGGTGVTTYAENMGVMAITKNFSSFTFVAASVFAICFGLSPKFGAAVQTIPLSVIGGLSFVVFGLITATAGRIWVDNKVDFTNPRNLIVVGVAVVIGAGDLTLKFGNFALGGIAVATFVALILYHVLTRRRAAAI
jgi:putative pyrimidine permease RutG